MRLAIETTLFDFDLSAKILIDCDNKSVEIKTADNGELLH